MKLERQSKRRSPPWPVLDVDLLRRVVERLCLKDRFCFRAVCKNWQACPIDDVPLTDDDHKIPWLMYYFFSPHHSLCSILHHRRKLSYVMEEERDWDDERGWIVAGSLLSRAIPCASRCGWVLFSEKIRKVVFNVNSSSSSSSSSSTASCCLRHVYQYYVYNPITKHIISLPPTPEMPRHGLHLGDIGIATFTSDPTSPDCLFVVPTIFSAHSAKTDDIFICTYGRDKTWKTHGVIPVHAMAYMGGSSIYYYNVEQGLSSFNIATQEWRRLLSSTNPALQLDIRQWDFIIGLWYFVAYGGNLHLVYLKESRINAGHDQVPAAECHMFKYDWLDGNWRGMESLEGGVIFIGNPSFGVEAGNHTKMVANRVYYFSINFHASSSTMPTPSFIVYGSSSEGLATAAAAAGMKGDTKSEFSDDQRQLIYNYEPCPLKIRSLGTVDERRRCWMWMEAPSSMRDMIRR